MASHIAERHRGRSLQTVLLDSHDAAGRMTLAEAGRRQSLERRWLAILRNATEGVPYRPSSSTRTTRLVA